MLVSGVLEHFPEKYLVAASGLAGLGCGQHDPDPPGLQTAFICAGTARRIPPWGWAWWPPACWSVPPMRPI